MSKNLTTDQMTTLLKTLTIFIDNRDPFTTENVINELKRSEDRFDGFHDDNGEDIVDDLYEEIDDAIDSLMLQFFSDFVVEERRVYIYEPREEHNVSNFYNEDEYETDKEGNRIPTDEEGVYDDTEDDLLPGEYKDPVTGDIDWDRDAAVSAEYAEEWYHDNVDEEKEFHDTDHQIVYDLTVDKQKRVNIKKKIFEEAGWAENEKVIIVGNDNNPNKFFILRYMDKVADNFSLGEGDYIFNNYDLKKGALRINIATLLNDVQPGEVIYAKVNWEDVFNHEAFNYIEVFVKV